MEARPKPTFETLPTELKIRIAEVCSAQDSRLHDRLLDISFEIDPGDEHVNEDSVDSVWLRNLRGRRFDSLGSLFQVSRAHCLVPSEQGLHTRYRAPYGHLVEDLNASQLSESFSTIDFLSALPLLSNLKSVSMESVATIIAALDAEDVDPWSGFEGQPYVEATLGRFLRRIPSVRLGDEGYHDTCKLCSGRVITKLDVSLDHAFDLDPLDRALRSLPALADLRLSFYGERTSIQTIICGSRDTASFYQPLTLRHLRIMAASADSFPPEFVRVISHLGHSARQLTLQTLGDVADDISVFPEGVSWPNVETLVVVNDDSIPANIIRHASTAVFPALRHLVWNVRMRDGLTDERMSVLRHFIAGRAGSAGPVDIRFENEDPTLRLATEVVDSKSGVSATVSYRCVLDEWLTKFAPDTPPVLYDPNHIDEAPTDVLHREVSASLRHGIEAAEQAAVVGDRRQLQRMAEALQALEYLRFEQRC